MAQVTSENFGRPTVGYTSGNPVKYTATAADVALGGANTTTSVLLANLPAGIVVNSLRIKHSAAFTGLNTSTPWTTATARAKINGTAMGSGVLDVFAAPGVVSGTGFITDITGLGSGKFDDVNTLIVDIVSSGNASGCLTGAVDVWVDYSILGGAA